MFEMLFMRRLHLNDVAKVGPRPQDRDMRKEIATNLKQKEFWVVEALKAFGSRPLAISRCQFTFVLAFAFLLHFRTCLGCVRGGKARCVVSFVDGCSFWLCPS